MELQLLAEQCVRDYNVIVVKNHSVIPHDRVTAAQPNFDYGKIYGGQIIWN